MTGLAEWNTNTLVETMSLGDGVAEHISVCRTWSFSRARTVQARHPLRQHCYVVDDQPWERFCKQVSQIPRIREALADRAPVADDHIERWFADPENLERAMRIVHARVIRRHRLLNQ